ncbi:MAG: DUF2141 domain-containing protein [bacterium]
MWGKSSRPSIWRGLTLILFIFLTFSAARSQGVQLEVEVHQIAPGEGTLKIGVFNNPEDFKTRIRPAYTCMVPAEDTLVTCKIKNMITGTYAIAVYHDENNDDKLNKRKLGIPDEGVGFSGTGPKTFKPPDFLKASFILSGDTTIVIPLKYPGKKKK